MNISKSRNLNAAALELAYNETVMTLASARNGRPWAAPVYYVYSGGCFWFFSSPGSIHIRDALASGAAAASIYAAPGTWQEIQGLQMQGQIQPAGSSMAALSALARYLKRFSFIDELLQVQLKKPEALDGPAFGRDCDAAAGHGHNLVVLERVFRVKWYGFKPEQAYYTDNRIAFGHREPVELA